MGKHLHGLLEKDASQRNRHAGVSNRQLAQLSRHRMVVGIRRHGSVSVSFGLRNVFLAAAQPACQQSLRKDQSRQDVHSLSVALDYKPCRVYAARRKTDDATTLHVISFT